MDGRVVNTSDCFAVGCGFESSLPTPIYQPAWVERSVASLCLFVCPFVRALTEKRLELSTPNLVHIYSIVVARHPLTQMWKGQRSRSHGYENRHGARLLVPVSAIPHTYAICGRCRRGCACRFDCLCFLVGTKFSDTQLGNLLIIWCTCMITVCMSMLFRFSYGSVVNLVLVYRVAAQRPY